MRLPRSIALLVAAVAAACAVAPALGETPEELDALADRSVDEQAGIALAQEQAGRGEWLEAIATLERTLAENPKSDAARLLHAYYLCKVDDRMGGAVEIGKLRTKNYSRQDLATARAQCGMAAED